MKKFIIVILILTILAAGSLLVACKKGGDQTPDTYAVTTDTISVPSDLPDYALKIEWYDRDGNPTANYNPARPTVIIFNGFSEYNRKENMTLEASVYSGTDTVVSTYIQLNRNLSNYWNEAKFNVGIFHYENFVDGAALKETSEAISQKIYNSAYMTYIDKSGAIKRANGFNLTTAFVSAWLSQMAAHPVAGSDGIRMSEVRFIGNSYGANLALSASDYLYALFDRGLIPATYLPNRVSILNPYFSNDGNSTPVEYRKEVTLGSALAYNESLIRILAGRGLVFDMVEYDEDVKSFYDEYTNRYSGVSETTVDGVKSVIWSDDGVDSALYKSIKKYVAYLSFRESYTSKHPAYYTKYDRAILDWYLYSIYGSDSYSDTTLSRNPMMDGQSYNGIVYDSIQWGVSAWTSTVYTRAARGAQFKMTSSETASKTGTPYTLTAFRSELYQVSNFTMDENDTSAVYGFFICGYTYIAKDQSSFVNLRRDALLEGVKIRVTVTDNVGTSETETYDFTSGSDGFYLFRLKASAYTKTVNVSMTLPMKNLEYRTAVASSYRCEFADKNGIDKDGSSVTTTDYSTYKSYIIIRNAGFGEIA